METIHAAHNLTIQLGPTSWQLFNGARYPDQPDTLIPLVEAHQGTIICAPGFAKARQIPQDKPITPADIARVVVGWAPESENWHLGLLLAARPETGFKMQWCGLATWPSGNSADYMVQAKLAGQSLARIIDRPFHLIPAATTPSSPMPDTQPLEVTAPMPALTYHDPELAIEPQEPPFEFEDRAMVSAPGGYVWQHNDRWLVSTGVRIVVFGALAALFFVLGIGTQTSGMASVSPAWLPWAGIGVGIVLILMAIRNFLNLVMVSDVIIDTNLREVRAQQRFGGGVRWRLPFEAIEYILISQTATRAVGRKHSGQPMQTAQDVWLHLYDGEQFWPVAEMEGVEGLCNDWDAVRKSQKQKGRRRLKLAAYNTPAHHAAQLMADTTSTMVWLDIR